MRTKLKIVFFLKPDAVIRRYVGARVLKTLLEGIESIKLLTFEKILVDKSFLADLHYSEHKGKFFFDWLVDYTAVAPIYFIMIEGNEEHVEKIRTLLGPTIVQKAIVEAPATIRARYGIYGGVNVAHASDSVSSAIRESNIWESYLRDKLGLMIGETEEVIRRIENYIDSYIDYPIIDNRRYIELSKRLSNHPEEKESIRQKFIELLSKETDQEFLQGHPNKVEEFAEILVRNALLRK